MKLFLNSKSRRFLGVGGTATPGSRALLTCLLIVMLTGACGAQPQNEAAFAESKAAYQRFRESKEPKPLLLKEATSTNEYLLLWVARELGEYSDAEALDALRTLAQHKQLNRQIPPVARAAITSLEKIESAPKLKQLQTSGPLEPRLGLCRQLALGTNDYARSATLAILVKQIPDQSSQVVPLLAECYPYDSQAKHFIHQYPQFAKPGLKTALQSSDVLISEGAIELVGSMQLTELVLDLEPFLRLDRNHPGNAARRLTALASLRRLGDTGVPLLRNLLQDATNPLNQLDALDSLQSMDSSPARGAIRDFSQQPQSKNLDSRVKQRLEEILRQTKEQP